MVVGCLLLVSLCACTGFAQTHSNPSPNRLTHVALVSYREQIEPYLKAMCSSCHSADKHNGGLVVDSPSAFIEGGKSSGSKLIMPGRGSASLLISYLNGKMQPRMPMGGIPATAAQIKMFESWINQGAKIDQLKPIWPYTPPALHSIPTVKNNTWVKNPIDSFVLAKLEANGLKPAPPANKTALIRRVYADLVGEPPTPAEADAYLSDTSGTAYEKVVDRLLADPRYGERWGRHWLDLVRYADSNGFENDGARPRAWRYRDYVIKSFNSDKPYDRFLKEQLAGDEIYPNDADAIVATGYARLTPWDELSTDHEQRWQDYLNDVTDTTGSVMLGLTVGCARCHNHKYDRISQADYYSMQSFFVATKWQEQHLPGDDPYAGKTASDRNKLVEVRQRIKNLREKYRDQAIAEKKKSAKPNETVQVDDGDLDRAMTPADAHNREELENQEKTLQDRISPLEPVAEAISEESRTAPAEHLLLRGNLHTPGPEVQPEFITSLCGGADRAAVVTPPATGRTTGRRAALAAWIASSDNPMTARVMVNRIWQHHFGAGIVGTPSDFGRNGDKPTHPELLDWLALKFVQDGWSIKKMHRLMLLSATYQQSTKTDPAAVKTDPSNRLLSHMNRIRLEGEALRDSILATSGRLNPEMYGPGVYPRVSDEVLSTGSTHKWGSSPEAEGLRRTVYVFQRRSLVLPIVEAFDAADMNNSCPRRAVTTIAPQALALFNGDFSRTESRYIAERVVKDAGSDPNSEIARAYQLILIRKPTAGQMALAQAFIEKQTQLHLAQPESKTTVNNQPDASSIAAAKQAALAELCHVLINTNEFLYLD
jgi:hypothetical protein